MKGKKLVQGVGINDADYVVIKRETIGYVDGNRKQKAVWKCPFYNTWAKMLERCYSDKLKKHHPTYLGCTATKEWLTFTSFKSWMEKQNFEGLELDKDILIKGNKLYSPETCIFVSPMVNSFTLDRGNDRGEWLIGVSWHKPTEKFIAHCSNPFTKKREHLGLFSCEQEAHNAWLKRKNDLAHELAAIQTDPRVTKALIERYSKPEEP